jgi:hypothetical protein
VITHETVPMGKVLAGSAYRMRIFVDGALFKELELIYPHDVGQETLDREAIVQHDVEIRRREIDAGAFEVECEDGTVVVVRGV